MALVPGLTAEATMVVTLEDTASSIGSGDIPVLGTPRLIALCEAATVAALDGVLDPGQTSVGIRVVFDHTRATWTGAEVTATARLEAIDGARLTFNVTAADDDGPVGSGAIVRFVVDRERFLDRG
jgi:predicted thioesterase